MANITLKLTLTVTYEPNGVSENTLEKMLRDIPQHAAGEGWMTGETDALVDDWSVKVERIG